MRKALPVGRTISYDHPVVGGKQSTTNEKGRVEQENQHRPGTPGAIYRYEDSDGHSERDGAEDQRVPDERAAEVVERLSTTVWVSPCSIHQSDRSFHRLEGDACSTSPTSGGSSALEAQQRQSRATAPRRRPSRPPSDPIARSQSWKQCACTAVASATPAPRSRLRRYSPARHRGDRSSLCPQ